MCVFVGCTCYVCLATQQLIYSGHMLACTLKCVVPKTNMKLCLSLLKEISCVVRSWCLCFLAHLSRRLIGELIVYQWSSIRPSVVRPFTMLKHLRNRLVNQSQILYRASLGRENKSLFAASWSHDQDGRHAHIW